MSTPSYLRYANQGATRNLPLDPRLVSSLAFLGDMGITAEVYSGGQPGKGSGGKRVGSTRHDHGNAADVRFFRGDQQLDWARDSDRPLFEDIVRRGREAGITGFGAGPGYMAPGTMHIGFGSPGVWGAGGRAANAPDWLRNAYGGASAGQSAMALGPEPSPSGASSAIQSVMADRSASSASSSTSPTTSSGGDMSQRPMIQIGPEKNSKLQQVMLERLMQGGGKDIHHPLQLAGQLAQVWALNSRIRSDDESNRKELERASGAAGLDPQYALMAQLGGDRSSLVEAMVAQQEAREAEALRTEERNWRQDERTYQRGRDTVSDQRFQQEREWQLQDAATDRSNGIADYRTKAEIDLEFADPKERRTFEGPDGKHYYEDGSPVLPGVEAPNETFRPATAQEAAAHGSAAGQFGPDNRFYPINPPSGMSVESDGAGGIRVTQGPGAGAGGGKVPTNFEPDPNNPGGVRPIAGGPGEQLPAEFAGRVGIADSFLGQAPALREQLLAGGVTGPWDRFQAGNNSSSPQAQLYRQLQSGADALQRLLTGAGMTENEAAVYAGRYLPAYTDDAQSAVTKLDQMVREIENVRAASLRGRGGSGATVTPNGPTIGAPQAGGSLRDKYGLE